MKHGKKLSVVVQEKVKGREVYEPPRSLQ